MKYTSMMISSGYQMTVPVAKRLRAARVSKVQITSDGDEATHDSRRHLTSGRGTFRRILDNIQAVTERRLFKVSVRVNLDGRNEPQARALLDALAARASASAAASRSISPRSRAWPRPRRGCICWPSSGG